MKVSGVRFQDLAPRFPDTSYETSGNDECRMSIDEWWNRCAQSFKNRQNTLFDVRCWTFDAYSPPLEDSTFNLLTVPTMFRMSSAAGLNSGQFNRKRNSEKANNEYRTRNIECRSNVFCLLYKKMTERSDSTIRQSSFDIRHSLKFHMRCQGTEVLNPET